MHLRRLIIFALVECVGRIRSVLSLFEETYTLLFVPGFEQARWQVGKWKAWRVYDKAKRNVPAYADFIAKNQQTSVTVKGWDPQFSCIPVTDKESYVKPYSLESRCVNGEFPRQGVVIDESSGTSGMPNNWVRGPKEREAVKTTLQTAVHHLVGTDPYIFINAFALGPWATGMNVSMSLVDSFILKSTGPDIQKIENTLNAFGPRYRYIIAGYPPFLKRLVDSTEVDWTKFEIIAFYGGEGMSESMRSYLAKSFKQSYGSYGASDLEINIAAENDFTIRLRNLLISNDKLCERLVKHRTLPMIFQYSPLDYYIETNDEGELIISLCRPSNISPKVRYNIHDLGHVVRMPELIAILAELGIPVSVLGSDYTDLPLLFHYGRSDLAVAFYGCKITPAEIQEIIFNDQGLASMVNSFTLITSDDERMNKRLTLALEMKSGSTPDRSAELLARSLFDALADVNQDYRESAKMVPAGLEPSLEIYPAGEGPFADSDIRLKSRYIQTR